jgi:5-methylcytosine-specific restriction endonuclease McrA
MSRDRDRRKNNKRRIGGRGGKYSLAAIAERDRCRCHLCCKRVDMKLSGSLPNGPTIDHLVPISLGGLDVPANVALAHRSCNIAKGSNAKGEQLRLVG